jgi:MHS family proline/betaine transporter-like MFS transporter
MLKKRFFFSVLAGHALEVYDSILYGYFASILAPLFFPSQDPYIATIVTFGTFAGGFLMRPLGGAFFGYLGDTIGRKKTLVISICATAVSTGAMGLIPTYAQIGLIAPFLLALFRLLQGFSVGGEYSGAAIFMVEHAPLNQKALFGSILSTFGFTGGLIATIIGSLLTLPAMPDYAWRFAFIFGALFGIVVYHMRKNVMETPAFQSIAAKNTILKNPLKASFLTQKKNMLVCMIIGGMCLVPLYMVIIYLKGFLIRELGVSTSNALAINTGLVGLWLVLVPLFGYWADRIGVRNFLIYAVGSIAMISLPVFYLMMDSPTIYSVIAGQIFISILGASFQAPIHAFVTLLFPAEKRFSGMAMSYNFGQAIIGSTTPLFAEALVKWTGEPASPGFYLLFASVITLFTLLLIKKPLSISFAHSASKTA